MIAEDIMRRDVVKIGRDATIKEAMRRMFEKHVSCLVVECNGSPDGLITRGDIFDKVIAEGDDPEKKKVCDVMSDPVVVIPPEWDIQSIARSMEETDLRRFPVVRDGKLVGFISSSDILRAKLGEK